MTRMPDFEREIRRDLGRLARHHGAPQPAAQVTHLSPSLTSGIMPCCGETPFDVPRTDRITTDRELVTCHGAPQPAPLPAGPQVSHNESTTEKESPVNLTAIASDIKDAVENADQWVKVVAETHLPSLLAQAQKYEGSPIVQALESAMLPPEVEATIADMITGLAAKYPAPASIASDGQQAPAGPAAPMQ